MTGPYAEVQARLARGEVDAAVAAALAWVASAPTDVLALIALGEALEARGQGALAARAYGSLLDLYPARADLLRAAAPRLARAGADALAVVAWRRAVRSRPEMPSGYHGLAWALAEGGDPDAALAVLEAGHHRTLGITGALGEDFAALAQIVIAGAPARAAELAERAARLGATVAPAPAVRFVLTWESDASNLDLHVVDRRHSRAWSGNPDLGRLRDALRDNVIDGWGPEEVVVPLSAARLAPYRLMTYVVDPGPAAAPTLGNLEVIETDGAGGFAIERRPFVATRGGAYVDLGRWR